jgi:hypothetical protein
MCDKLYRSRISNILLNQVRIHRFLSIFNVYDEYVIRISWEDTLKEVDIWGRSRFT